MSKQFRWAVFFLSASLFAASLAFPAFVCQQGRVSWKGYEVLMLGWLGVIGFDPRWWANLALLLVWSWLLAAGKSSFPSKSVLFCAVAAITTLLIPPPLGCPGMDTPTAAIGIALGGYLWASALLLVVIGIVSQRVV
jgi:restriction system protein